MTALRDILLFLHLTGFALLLGGAVAQYRSGKIRINQLMIWGSGAQVVTGLALGAALASSDRPSPGWFAVKLIVALAIFAMVFFPRKRESVNPGHFLAIVGLTLVNLGVAVFWH
jgi:hypothetical protein